MIECMHAPHGMALQTCSHVYNVCSRVLHIAGEQISEVALDKHACVARRVQIYDQSAKPDTPVHLCCDRERDTLVLVCFGASTFVVTENVTPWCWFASVLAPLL
jgi:hypothetical protein